MEFTNYLSSVLAIVSSVLCIITMITIFIYMRMRAASDKILTGLVSKTSDTHRMMNSSITDIHDSANILRTRFNPNPPRRPYDSSYPRGGAPNNNYQNGGGYQGRGGYQQRPPYDRESQGQGQGSFETTRRPAPVGSLGLTSEGSLPSATRSPVVERSYSPPREDHDPSYQPDPTKTRDLISEATGGSVERELLDRDTRSSQPSSSAANGFTDHDEDQSFDDGQFNEEFDQEEISNPEDKS
jgi:hypothetical protein